MVTSLTDNSHNIDSLIKLGAKGLYPIFHSSWIEEAGECKKRKITTKDKANINAIIKSLAKHKNLERKKTILMALSDEDRTIFVIDFLQKVELEILGEKPELQ